MPNNNSLGKAVNVGQLAILKEYADDTFSTKEETGVEPVSSATSMWSNFNY